MSVIFGRRFIFFLICTITFISSAAKSNEAVKGFDSYYSSGDRSLLIPWEYEFGNLLWIRCYFNAQTPKFQMTAASHVFSYQHRSRDGQYFKHLKDRGSYILIKDSFQLYIHRPSVYDEGYYKCEFRSADSKTAIHGISRVKQSVNFLVKGQSSSVITGEDMAQLEWYVTPKGVFIERVRCKHKQEQDPYRHLINYTVGNGKWSAVGNWIKSAQYKQSLGEFTLLIDSPVKRDVGDYLCEFFGSGNRERAVAELSIHVPLRAVRGFNESFCPGSFNTSLVWSLYPSDSTVYSISCVFFSSHENHQQSYKHKVYSLDIRSRETEIHGHWAGRVKHTLNKDEFLLIILKPGVSDVGWYKCGFRGAKDTHRHDEVYLEEDPTSCEISAADGCRRVTSLIWLLSMLHLEYQ